MKYAMAFLLPTICCSAASMALRGAHPGDASSATATGKSIAATPPGGANGLADLPPLTSQ